MKITRHAPVPPDPTYTLELTHEELVALRAVAGWGGVVNAAVIKMSPQHNGLRITETLSSLWEVANGVLKS